MKTVEIRLRMTDGECIVIDDYDAREDEQDIRNAFPNIQEIRVDGRKIYPIHYNCDYVRRSFHSTHDDDSVGGGGYSFLGRPTGMSSESRLESLSPVDAVCAHLRGELIGTVVLSFSLHHGKPQFLPL